LLPTVPIVLIARGERHPTLKVKTINNMINLAILILDFLFFPSIHANKSCSLLRKKYMFHMDISSSFASRYS
jgi:hypothetical protein